MACTGCAAASAALQQQARVARRQSPAERQNQAQLDMLTCEYNNDILNIWDQKLTWFKNKALYVKYNYQPSYINASLGIIRTSLNIYRKCEYKPQLDAMVPLITLITSIE